MDLLQENDIVDCRKVGTPLNAGIKSKCGNGNCERADLVRYQSIIDSLMYLRLSTTPDILYSVTKLPQYSRDLHREHLGYVRLV